VQQRLESTGAGRLAISVFVLFTVFSVVVWNLPTSEIKKKALKVARPYITLTSLDQNWGVFSPDPRRISIDMVARVQLADGTEETLRVRTRRTSSGSRRLSGSRGRRRRRVRSPPESCWCAGGTTSCRPAPARAAALGTNSPSTR
jgi:hypothetical protein